MRKILNYALLWAFTLLVVGCSSKDGDPFPTPGGGKVGHVVFIYMGADNSLGGRFDLRNIEGMLKGMTTDKVNEKSRIVIYHDKIQGAPELLMITPGETKGELEMVKDYPEYESTSSADMGVFNTIFGEVKELTKGARSYGLIMWSHATGWLPGKLPSDLGRSHEMLNLGWYGGYLVELDDAADGDTTESEKWAESRELDRPKQAHVLEDSGEYLELSDFMEGLPTEFDYIIFDQCFMAGVEVAWALRDKTKQLLVSPAEVMGAGMPYEKIVEALFSAPTKLGEGGVAEIYYEHYKNSASEVNSATTALWDCSQIDEEFADIVAEILELGADKIATLPTGDKTKIQHYDRTVNFPYRYVFDIKGFVEQLAFVDEEPEEPQEGEEGEEPEESEESIKSKLLQKQFFDKLDKIVVYKKTTDNVVNVPKNPEMYSGMTTYITVDTTGYRALNEKYKETEWYKRVYPKEK